VPDGVDDDFYLQQMANGNAGTGGTRGYYATREANELEHEPTEVTSLLESEATSASLVSESVASREQSDVSESDTSAYRERTRTTLPEERTMSRIPEDDFIP